MQSLIVDHLSVGTPFSYVLVFFGMVFGGEEVLFMVAFFLYREYLTFFPTFIALFLGATTGDILWFVYGGHIMKHPIIVRISSRIAFLESSRVKKHDAPVIFLSKFIYGIHHITLAKLRASGEPFFRFLWLDALASLVWIASIGGLGFTTSFSISQLRHMLRFFEVGLALILLFYFILSRFVTPVIKKILKSVVE